MFGYTQRQKCDQPPLRIYSPPETVDWQPLTQFSQHGTSGLTLHHVPAAEIGQNCGIRFFRGLGVAFQESGSVVKRRLGAVRTARTPENVERVRQSFLQSRRSARKHAAALRLSD